MDLDRVEVGFTADVAEFVANVRLARDAAAAFRDGVIADVAEIRAALDSLPDVVHVRVDVDTTGLGSTAVGAGAAAAAADAQSQLEDAIQGIRNAATEAGGAAGFEAAALRELRDISASLDMVTSVLGESETHLAVIQRDAADASADLMMQTQLLRAATLGQAGAALTGAAAMNAQQAAAYNNARTQYMLAMAQRMQANTAVAGAAANTANAAAAGRAGRLWGVLPLTWNAIHWALTGTAEALAVVVPAMVALGSAGAVGLQGAVDVAQRMQAVYTATEATMSYLGKTVSTGIGQGLDSFTASAGQAADAGARLRDNLQKAQDAAQPRVYELLGAAIDGANSKFNVFNQVGSQTIGMLDQFAAKIDIELRGPLGALGTQISQNSVEDLRELGQVFGNLGHAVAVASGEMPGMADMLLKVLDAGTQVLSWATQFRGVMQGLLLAHEAQMWGGLLTNILGRVSTSIAATAIRFGGMIGSLGQAGSLARTAGEGFVSFGMGAGRVAQFLGGPWGTAIAAAGIGLGFLITDLMRTRSATQLWISSLESTVAQSSGLEQVGATYQALTQVTIRNAEAQKQAATATRAYNAAAATGAAVGSRFDDAVARSGEHVANMGAQMNYATANAGALSDAQRQLTRDWNNEIGNVRLLSSEYKISYVNAAELAGDAGVSLTQSLKGNSIAAQEARQMITNLIAGYGGMASVGSELGQDINAVSFAADIQNGDVTKLNQAWDTFISTVQAPSSTFLSFAQSLRQYGSDAKNAGAEITGLGGATVKASHDVSGASIQLQQDFNSSVTSAEQMLDSMRTVATITGNGGPLVAGIRDVVQALIPLAGKNEAARAQLFALAQEAGGPASGSMQALAKWAGHTKDPLNNLYSLSMNAAGAIQKLGADTQSLAATVQSTLNQTLVTEAENITHVSHKTATYLLDLQNLGAASPVTQAALANLNDATGEAVTLSSQAASGISALSGKVQQEGQAAQQHAAARQAFNSDVQRITDRAPSAAQDVANLSAEIASGRWASQVAARAQVIRDLENTGLSAQQAASMVDSLITAIDGLHSKTVTVTTVMQAVSGSAAAGTSPGSVHGITGPSVGGATGMLVPGHGTGDTVPAMLSPGEAVVPRHLVPAISGFLGAHHVPGFAAGGIVHGGHGSSALSLGALIDLQWSREILARRYLHSRDYVQMEQLMRHGHIIIGHNDRLSGFLMGDLLRRAERLHVLEGPQGGSFRQGLPGPVGGGGWGLGPPAVIRKLIAEELGGGQLPYGIYDQGGYLPLGWSLAYNGTRSPEPVGGGGGDVHVHLHGDLADDTLWERMQVTTAEYGVRNSGRPTGTWQPGQ